MPETPLYICMTTFNPPRELFRRQIESLIAQSHSQWICLVQDDSTTADATRTVSETIAADARFEIRRNRRTIGFYHNFERVLSRVPPRAGLVCLADQDDYWYPHKLTTLIEAMRTQDVSLAWGNMRVVDVEDKTLAQRYTARSSPIRMQSLFFTNTIPGAACMFRASLLRKILPFPAQRGTVYHDWWIALVALAAGNIRFVDEVLQDYVQHDSNAVGWQHHSRPLSLARLVISRAHRRELLDTARTLYDQDCRYLAEAIDTLCERVPHSPHLAAMNRLRRLLTHPRQTMLMQYLRALRSTDGSRRQRNLLLAQMLGRTPTKSRTT